MACENPAIYENTKPSEHEGDVADWREELLSRHADGQADEAQRSMLVEHLQDCITCRELFEQFLLLNRLASRRNETVRLCPPTSTLDSFASQPEDLDASALKHVREHLVNCKLCRMDVAWLRRVQGTGTPFRGYGWRRLLPLAAALLLILGALWGVRTVIKSRAESTLVAMAALPEVEMSQVESLPELRDAGDRMLFEDAVALVQQSRMEEAADILQKIGAREPNQLRVLFLTAYSCGRMGDLRRAAGAVRKIRCRPGVPARCWYLANLLIKLHEWDRASQELDHVLAIEPMHARAREFKEKLRAF